MKYKIFIPIFIFLIALNIVTADYHLDTDRDWSCSQGTNGLYYELRNESGIGSGLTSFAYCSSYFVNITPSLTGYDAWYNSLNNTNVTSIFRDDSFTSMSGHTGSSGGYPLPYISIRWVINETGEFHILMQLEQKNCLGGDGLEMIIRNTYDTILADSNSTTCGSINNLNVFTNLTNGEDLYFIIGSRANNYYDYFQNFKAVVSKTPFFVLPLSPIIFVDITEANNSILTRNFIQINTSVYGQNLTKIYGDLLDSSNLSIANFISTSIDNSSTSLNVFANFTGLSDGIYYFNATAYNIFGNTSKSEKRQVFVRFLPIIDFETPTESNGATINRTYIQVNATAENTTGRLIQNLTIYIYNQTGLVDYRGSIYVGGTDILNYFYNFTGLPDNTYFFNATAYDSIGISNSTPTYQVIINTTISNITINNTAPTTPNLTLSPSTIYINQTLTATASNSTDAENNSITYYYEFDNVNDAAVRQAYSTTATYIIQNIDVNDTIRVRAWAFDGLLNSTNYAEKLIIVSFNNLNIYPTLYTKINQENQSFIFNLTLNQSSSQNLSFNLTLSIQNSTYFNFTYNPSYIANFGLIQITINTTAPAGTYTGNITIIRNIDNETKIIPVTLSIIPVGTPQGNIFIESKQDWYVTIYNNQQAQQSFLVNNTGNYNLTNCIMSINGAFTGQTFYSFSQNNFTLTPNQTRVILITHNLPPTGIYSGNLHINCIATSNGLTDDLDPSNQPHLSLISVTPSTIPGGGGGGVTNIINQTEEFKFIPNIVDMIFIITNFNPDVPVIWVFNMTTNKIIDRCEIDNGFSCSVSKNIVTLKKDYTNINTITSYDKATLKVYYGSQANQHDISVRMFNLAYYIPYESNNYPTLLTGYIIKAQNNSMKGIFFFPILISIILIYFLIRALRK